ncbi:aspartate aminotransferase family protein [Fodinicurvata halophila]|uniref:Aspartate aminotransferase family protein n=2 Tax=Fodinicurvata halophila TaxID=1419723 RepID=A0ABV8UM14_9PROT
MSPDPKPNTDLATALDDAASRYLSKNPLSFEQHNRARQSMPGGNTRTVLYCEPFPITIAEGDGAYIRTLDGHEYVDFLGEYTAGLYGHSEPIIIDAAKKALDGGIVLGGHTQLEQQLAELLCDRFPSLERVRFTNSGTEANLMAMSLARATTGRNKILVFHGAYHGGVFVFAGGGSPINAPFEFVLGQYNDIESTLELVREHASDLAAIVVEPMMGAGGCIPAKAEFLQGLQDAATDAGALFIFDEVMTSRLAPGGLQELLDITPDLTVLGKYIGGGFSFGAFGGASRLMDHFDPHKPGSFPHAGTFNNNILTMSAGYAGMSRVFTSEASRELNQRGENLRHRLNEICKAAGVPMQFTGRGSMMTVHMREGEIHSPKDAAQANSDLRELFFLDLIDAGVWLARRGMINVSLPMRDAEFDKLCAAVEEFVSVRKPLLVKH